MVPATSVDEVIARLDEIVEWSQINKSRMGYFAILYRNMTLAVREGIRNNLFADGERMAQLDVIFANRYLHAWDAYVNKQPCTNAWCAAFDAAENSRAIVLQHLLLGINTHINLDLAIAAAACSTAANIHDLESDFLKINSVIADLTQKVQDTLAKIWMPMRLINKITNKEQDAVINFSIDLARKISWKNALTLAAIDDNGRQAHISKMDNDVVCLAKKIANPGFFPACYWQ